MTKKILYLAIAVVVLQGVSRPGHTARKSSVAAIPMDATDIAGVSAFR
jgi:hypothetical protein